MRNSLRTIIIATAITLCNILGSTFCNNLFSQTISDAILFSQQYNQGTARSVAMGNAFAGLGGDMGAITINPASGALFGYSQLSITPLLYNVNNTATYIGNTIKDSKTNFNIANVGLIYSEQTGKKRGLVNLNVGLAITGLNNYNQSISAAGREAKTSWLSALAYNTNGINATQLDMNERQDPFYNNPWDATLAWNLSLLDTLPGTNDQYLAATENLNGYDIMIGGDLDQLFTSVSTGSTYQYDINLAVNISNKLYAGLNLGVTSLRYKYRTFYRESAANFSNFNSGFHSMEYEYRQLTSGVGMNFKVGIIYKPIKNISIGGSISTPTWTFIQEEWESNMKSEFIDYNNRLLSPLGNYKYRLNTPFRWNLGAAYLSSFGAISIDYESVDYGSTKLVDEYSAFTYNQDNEYIKRNFTTQNILRVGGELLVTPNISARLGYQNYSAVSKNNNAKLEYGSLGVGYTSNNGFFMDIAYQQLLHGENSNFTLYGDTDLNAPVGALKRDNWNLLLTIGLSF